MDRQQALGSGAGDGTSSYDLILDAVDGVLKISKRQPYQVLASYPMTVERAHLHTLKVVAQGSTLEGYLDGVKRLTVTDTTYTDGHLGVILFRSTVTYDDLEAQRIPWDARPRPLAFSLPPCRALCCCAAGGGEGLDTVGRDSEGLGSAPALRRPTGAGLR